MKKLQVVLASACLLCFSGCGDEEPKQLQKWDVIITSPHGERYTHSVMSYSKPKPDLRSNGQIKVVDNGCTFSHDWEQQIVAPVGWMLTVEPSK